MTYRFHVPGLAHTVTTPEYSTCAFTTKVVKLCRMLKRMGHTVIHYGHEDSVVDCDEHVTVTKQSDLDECYPGHDWKTQGFPEFKLDHKCYMTFNANAIGEIFRRRQRGDFLLCSFGAGHRAIGDVHKDMIVVEPGIGYPGGTFAPFKVYESYAVMHTLYGLPRLQSMFGDGWYDAVIPNYYDLDDFIYRDRKDDFFLFLGRIGPGKGTNVAIQTVEAIGGKLVIAGMGNIPADQTRTDRPMSEYIRHVGVVNPKQRAELLSRAKATICPSMYIEPFCGVHVEGMLSGTPAITTDWGAFAEYNIHGTTGYRCRTLEQFCWAAREIETIKPETCRAWAAANFSLERVGQQFEEYFWGISQIYNGNDGWYTVNPERQNLDWLKKVMPP